MLLVGPWMMIVGDGEPRSVGANGFRERGHLYNLIITNQEIRYEK